MPLRVTVPPVTTVTSMATEVTMTTLIRITSTVMIVLLRTLTLTKPPRRLSETWSSPRLRMPTKRELITSRRSERREIGDLLKLKIKTKRRLKLHSTISLDFLTRRRTIFFRPETTLSEMPTMPLMILSGDSMSSLKI